MDERTIVILKTGDTFDALKRVRGDFEEWIGAAMGEAAARTTVVDARRGLPDVRAARGGVIVTGSPDNVTERTRWMEDAAEWLHEVVETRAPVLGICFGHQLLAHALGGTVGWHAGGREVGTVDITATAEGRNDALLRVLPATFPAHSSHAQTVITLPPEAALLAHSDFEPHHAFRVGPCAWGVQFHPEFDEQIMQAYVEHHRSEAAKSGTSANVAPGEVRPSSAGRLLARFAELAAAGPTGAGDAAAAGGTGAT